MPPKQSGDRTPRFLAGDPTMGPGVILSHKPVGPTSFSVVRGFLAEAGAAPRADGRRSRRVCHGGTLDPFAHGLLLILVEPATRLFDHLHAVPKVYEATVRWGAETDNGDPLGRVTARGDAGGLSPRQLDDALAGFVGWHDQTPPATSNKRVGGERAYQKAHRGETVALPPSRVYLHEARWLGHDLPDQSRLRVAVRGGFYVRSLARDLGRLVGCGAHLTTLHRTAIGPWEDPGPGRRVEVRGRGLLPWTPTRILNDGEATELLQGRTIGSGELLAPDWPLPPGFPPPDPLVRGFHREHLAFLLRPDAGGLSLINVLPGGL